MDHITLIGMAGTGKSTWAKRFETRGFLIVDCDREIAGRLSLELDGGIDLIAALGQWMGLPWEPHYEERSRHYRDIERDVMDGVIQWLREPVSEEEEAVVDTAGSVIYTGAPILRALSQLTRMVHLETPQKVQEEMLAEFISRPGPVVWNGMFSLRDDESHTEALARCYPRLLAHREKIYRSIAHVTIPHSVHRREGAGVEDFLEHLIQVSSFNSSGPEPAPGYGPRGG